MHAGGRETPEDQVLRLVNQHRKTAGLAPVTLDRKLSKGCMEHAEYMRLNRGTAAMEGLAAHKQRPDLPGATAAGAACGKAADLYPEVSDFGAAVEGWMAGFYHRRPILDPGLGSIAVGYAPLPGGSYMAALMFPEHKAAETGWPVAYPADGQTGVALRHESRWDGQHPWPCHDATRAPAGARAVGEPRGRGLARVPGHTERRSDVTGDGRSRP